MFFWKNAKIVLASSSPRRRELLTQIGLTYEVITPDLDENAVSDEPGEMVREIAREKCEIVCKKVRKEGFALVIAADTTVCLDGQILGKPESREDAFDMLSRLQGKMHTVHTGVCLCRTDTGRTRNFSEAADVFMKKMSDSEIRAYIDTGEPLDKAGAYGLQGIGAVFVEKIVGDYSTVVGLPLCALVREAEGLFRE